MDDELFIQLFVDGEFDPPESTPKRDAPKKPSEPGLLERLVNFVAKCLRR